MSGRFLCAPEEIVLDARLSKTELRVLLCLFLHKNKATQKAFPRRETIAELTGYDKSVISRATTGLRNKGWISTKQSRGPNEYFLSKPDLETVTTVVTVLEPLNSDHIATVAKPSPVTESSLNSDLIDNDTVTTVVTPKQIINIPVTEKEKEEEKEKLRFEVVRPLPLKPSRKNGTDLRFDEWYAHYPKKTTKKPALAYWKANRATLDPIADKLIADTIARKRDDEKWKNGYIKDPIRYLRDCQWEDEIQTPMPNHNERQNATDRALAKLDQLERDEFPARAGQEVDLGDLEETEAAVWEPVFVL